MDAKAADFDTSALTAQVASVQEPANEPVAEEVLAEQADVAETAEGAVTEQASSESPFGTAAFSEAPAQQLTPQSVDSSADKPLFNLILPIVAIALAVIFSILAWFVSPTWLFIILKVLTVTVAVVSLVFSLKSSKKLLSIIAIGVAVLMIFVSIGGLIFQISQNSSDSTSSSKTSKVADKDDDDKKMMTAIQNQTQKVIALTSTITLTKMLNLTGMNLNSRS